MTTTLSKSDVLLLQQLHDGETPKESAADLLQTNPAARVYLTALGEMKLAATAAMDVAWGRADAPTAETIAEIARNASSLVDAPLSELAPMLERFHDGEVDTVEAAVIIGLLEEREDLADYVFSLDTLSDSVRHAENDALEGVNFDSFFDGVAAKLGLETEEQPELDSSYEHDEHRVLVYRYHDDQVSAEERMRVQAWLDAGHDEVTGTVDALEELQFSAVTAIEYAQEKVDFSMFWGGVQDKLEHEAEQQGENVVSLSRKREQKRSVYADYRQGITAAIAATILIGGFLGLFGKQIFGTNERVIEKIVIVDSVEYAPGASVMINSPMEPASADSDEALNNQDDEPTVIWLLDSGDDSLEESDGEEPEDNEIEEETTEQGQPI